MYMYEASSLTSTTLVNRLFKDGTFLPLVGRTVQCGCFDSCAITDPPAYQPPSDKSSPETRAGKDVPWLGHQARFEADWAPLDLQASRHAV